MSRGTQGSNEPEEDPYRGGLNLPHELQMLPDDAMVQWGWVRGKLLAVEDDPLEASIRYWEWLVTRNLNFGPDGKQIRLKKKRTKRRSANESEEVVSSDLLSALASLPDEALVPVGWIRETLAGATAAKPIPDTTRARAEAPHRTRPTLYALRDGGPPGHQNEGR